MVPDKEVEGHFGELEVGDKDSIQKTVDDFFYNLWGMKEPNSVMSMMATGVRLLGGDTCKENTRRWK